MAVTIENIDLDMEEEQDQVDNPNNVKLAECKKEMGNSQFKLKNYAKALPFYTEAIELNPLNANYFGNRAACYLMLGQYTKALEDASQSVTLDPEFLKGWIRMAKCHLARGEIVNAEGALAKAKALNPKDPSVRSEENSLNDLKTLVEKGDKAYASGDYRMVVYCMDRALLVSPSCSNFKVIKAECLARIGNYQDAQEFANEVLAFDKRNADAIFVRGICLYYQDNMQRAIEHFKLALKLVPDHSKAKEFFKIVKTLEEMKEKGNAAYKGGKYQEAYQLYTDALTIDPRNVSNNAKLYFNRATVLAKLEKTEESLSDCNEALKLDPNYLKALLRRAQCYMDLSQYEEAVRDYEKAAKLDSRRDIRTQLNAAKLALKKSHRKDYYKILGVSTSASTEEIKRAYKKRALVHHPDRHADASEVEKREQEKKFIEVGEAYEVLSDPQKRAKYDNGQNLDDFMGFSEDSSYCYGSGFPVFQTFFDSSPFSGTFTYHTS